MLTVRNVGLVVSATMLLMGLMLSGQQAPASTPAAPVAAALRDYPTVTAARLLKPADGDWLIRSPPRDGPFRLL